MTLTRLEHDVELSEEEFRLLRDFVHERFGLYFDGTQRGRLRARLAPRLALLGLVSFEDYYRHLRFAPERAQEQQRMVSHLTNNETYFFREQPQLEVFSSKVLPSLKERQCVRFSASNLVSIATFDRGIVCNPRYYADFSDISPCE